MADHTYHEVTKVQYQWRVPGAYFGGHGAAISELYKAIASAENAYREIYGKDSTYDDWLRVYAADEEVILWFEVEVGN